MTLDVQGDLRDWLRELDTLRPERVAQRLNHEWADDARERLREYVAGGPVTNYLRLRSGAARDSVQATSDAQGGAVSATGPGMNVLEEGTAILPGGVIKPRTGLYLTFRIRQPWDGAQATGPWVRVREVRIKPRHMVRDAAVQAFDALGDHLDSILGGAA